ncbi:ABC transporter substrate-binding protein [Chloroflexota bacterium]
MKSAKARLLTMLLLAIVTACTPDSPFSARSTVPVYRMGIVLPHEGAHRAMALDAFFASRAALLEALRSNTMDGYRVEIIAYDDFGDPAHAANHATALTTDSDVLIAIGHWLPETTAAALPVYQEAGLPLITTVGQTIADRQTIGDETAGVAALDAPPTTYQDVLTGYQATSTLPDDWQLTNAAYLADLEEGAVLRELILNSDPSASEPGPYAALAYDATHLALAAIAQAAQQGPLTRASVAQALAQIDYEGVTGPITFAEDGFRIDAPLYLYDLQNKDAPQLLAQLP